MRQPILLILLLCISITALANTNEDRIAPGRTEGINNRVATGEHHTLYIRNGTLWACGLNFNGQLGDGTNVSKSTFVQIGMDDDWMSVAAGAQYSVGIKADGTLWAWGRNNWGQLGDGSTTDRHSPIKIGTDNNWARVCAGLDFTLAIKTDGTLWTWGRWNNTPVQRDTANTWTKISVGWWWWPNPGFGSSNAIGLKADGSLWHIPVNGQLAKVSTDTWVDIAAGGFHGMAIKKNGTLWAWGDNYYGQIGNTNQNYSPSIYNPAQVGTSKDWVSIAASRYNSAGIKADGTLWTWGYGGYSVLARGGHGSIPAKVGAANDWVGIEVSWFHSVGIKADGTLWAWGLNTYGDLGNGTTSRGGPFHVNSSDDWLSVTAGGVHSLGLRTDGTLWAWGQNDWGQLGDNSYTNKNNPVRVGSPKEWAHVEAGITHNVGIKADGTLWAWGLNTYGQLGDGTNTNKNYPIQIDTIGTWVAISAGGHHSFGIKADGSLWAWGYNQFGELGDNTNTNKNTPVRIDTANNWIAVSAGAHHSVALKSDGTIWAWGLNTYGQLGDGTNVNKSKPVQLGIAGNWITISAGYFHTLAIKADGTLWAWGRNNWGQLGDSSTISKNAPVKVGTADNWVSITAHSEFSLGIRADGTLWGWGLNYKGQLGIGSYANKSTPAQVSNDNNWVCISAGTMHTLGIKADRTRICATGDNTLGQLGSGDTISRNSFSCICPGYIYDMPVDTTLCSTGNAYFKLKAKYATAYQWQVNTGNGWTNLNNSAIYNGALTDSLHLTNVTSVYNNYRYRCIMYNDCSEPRLSDSAQLTFSNPPIVTTQPKDTAICSGANTYFNIGATNSPLIYQWQVNSGTGWYNIVNTSIYNGATANKLELTAVPANFSSNLYRCIVSNKCSPPDTSYSAILTVDTFVSTAVSITSNDTDICAGQTANFTATPVNGGTNPIFQWQVAGVSAGTNSASFSTSTLSNGNVVRCIMTSDVRCPAPKVSFSNGIGVQVTQNVTPIISITSDRGTSWCSGKENIFRSGNTNGGSQPWYQWKINGVDIGPDADTLWVPYLNDGDVVECDMVSSAKCPLPDTVSSNKINMTILPTTKSSIIIMPNPDSIICKDENVTMYCAFTNGGTTPAFQWMLNGKDIPGETMGTFKTTSLNSGDIINCRFISSGTCVFPEVSNPVGFVVNPEVRPEISITVLYIGNNQHLFTALPVNGGTNPVYRWYLNGRQLKDEQGNTVTLAALTRADKVWVEMASSECVAANMRLVSSKKITTGIEENHTSFKTLVLHPSPNKGIFVVEGDLALASVQEVNMTILNNIGQVIHREQVPVLSGKLNYTVTTKDLPPGGYLLKLDYDGGQDFSRFVIVR